MADISEDLVKAIRDGSLIPFVGAGLSMSVGRGLFPSWDRLVLRLADRLDRVALKEEASRVRELSGKGQLIEAAEAAFSTLTNSRFREEMEEAFDVPPPPQADLSTVEALWNLEPPLIITTNYDSVLEWPLPKWKARSMDNDEPALLRRIASSTPDQPLIWYLHGSIRRPGTLIFNLAQYEGLYGKESVALSGLQHVLATRPLLFVGFSLKDRFVLQQIKNVLKFTSNTSPVSYVLVHKGEGEENKALLDEYHIQRVEFEDFGGPLAQRLVEIGRKAWGDHYGATGKSEILPWLLPLVQEVERILQDVILEPARIAQAFNFSKPLAWDILSLFGHSHHLLRVSIERLATAVRQGEDGPFPLLEFVRQIEVFCPPAAQKKLKAWRQKTARALTTDEQDRKRLLRGRAQKQSAAGSLYTLLRIAEDPSGSFRAQAWVFTPEGPQKIFSDERSCSQPDLIVLVNDVLDTLDALGVDKEETMLAFLLPRRLLVEAVDQWRPVELVAELPIGVTHLVSIRSLDRLLNRRRSMRRLQQAWQGLQAIRDRTLTIVDLASAAKAVENAVWLSWEDGARPGIVQDLESKQVVCAVLAGAPPAQPTEPMSDLLNAVLQAGVPVVLWMRDPAARDPARVRAKVEELLTGTSVERLVEKVRQRRQEAIRDSDPNHTGRCLALLWDDPERLPPDYDPANRARVERS